MEFYARAYFVKLIPWYLMFSIYDGIVYVFIAIIDISWLLWHFKEKLLLNYFNSFAVKFSKWV